MSEKTETSIRTEYRDGKKIVTTTTVVTTDINSGSPGGAEDLAVLLDSNLHIGPTPSSPVNNFQGEALERHNYYRNKHGVPPLQWCSKCAKKAQNHADYLARTDSFSHSTEKGFGENLFSSMSSKGPNISASKAVDSWYDEIKDMKFGIASPENFSQVGHFTQVVWKATTHVGMAYAIRGNSVFVVANYLPPGNIVGTFHQNVFPPQK